MASLTFDDQHRAKTVCLAALALLLSNQAHAQQPPGPQSQPAVAFPDAPAQPAPSGYPPNPQAPPPPPPPPPYATTSAPPPAYGPPPGPAPQPTNGYPPPANVAPGQYPPAYPPQGSPQYPPPGAQQYPPGQPQPYPPPGSQGYPPQGQQGYPSQGYPTQGQAGYPPPGQPGAPTYANAQVEAPTQPQEQSRTLKIPDFSVRVDPLNWIVSGKLGFELEVEALEWLTIETVPIFVMAHEPFSLPSFVQQYSNGLGPLAGASLSAGFWLEGDSFRGTVIRAGLTNYAYRYVSFEKVGFDERGDVLDSAKLTQTRLNVMLGSGRRFGYFTIAGGFGIEYDLRDERQCLVQQAQWVTKNDGCRRSDYVLRRRKDEPDAANLRGFLYPFEFVFRFSLGVVFDD